MMKYVNNHVLAIRDAADCLFELRQRDVAIIQYVPGSGAYAQGQWCTVIAFVDSQRPAFGARQSQINEIDLVNFRNRPEVSRGCKAQSLQNQNQ